MFSYNASKRVNYLSCVFRREQVAELAKEISLLVLSKGIIFCAQYDSVLNKHYATLEKLDKKVYTHCSDITYEKIHARLDDIFKPYLSYAKQIGKPEAAHYHLVVSEELVVFTAGVAEEIENFTVPIPA